MKILVVTSEVTFVPDNYNHFLTELFKGLSGEADLSIELVILKNNSLGLPIKGLALALMGARSIGFHLIKNSFKARSKDRLKLASDHNIKMHFFTNPNSPEFHKFTQDREIDLIVNARTRFIYKSKILKIPKLAAINIHHGLLPDYRGTMCDLWALQENRPTGFTIHVMDKKIDNGSIIKRVETSVHGDNVRKSFSQLIFESSKREGTEMAQMIKIINKNQTLPIELDNISTNPVYTKNPDFKSIRSLLKKGIKL
jgi:folate-dependent phosphoribosylglycinamide formyltransferase PurN